MPMTLRRFAVVVGTAPAAPHFAPRRLSILSWGAGGEAADSRLPGDELLDNSDGVATRAIDARMPASAILAWIAQMGAAPRSFAYDWIENLLGLNMYSADTVLLEIKHPEVGGAISYMGSTGCGWSESSLGGCSCGAHRTAARSGHSLNQSDPATGLISRHRFRLPRHGADAARLTSPVMERETLHWINRRAVQLASIAAKVRNALDRTVQNEANRP